MPRNRQRNLEPPGEVRAYRTYVARADYVDDVRLKRTQFGFHSARMPPQCGIVRKIVVERESQRPALQFDVCYQALPRGSGFRSAADAEERKLLPPRKVRELPARQRDAVDLLKRVGEKGNTSARHLPAV